MGDTWPVERSSECMQQAAPCRPRAPPQDKTGSHERWHWSDNINSNVDAIQEMALRVRGGGEGSDDEASVMTLFIRVLWPGFGREKSGDGELDLEGGGLLRRLKRLVAGVFRTVKGSSASASPKGKTSEHAKLGLYICVNVCHR